MGVDLNRSNPKQILFGDLHVHTTFSVDAFLFSLPTQGGTGTHPPADACDFARFCADLDFFSFNDHAEGLLQEQWQEIKKTTRTCNEIAGPPENPDLVVFPGWEWTQLAEEPAGYYGHKNVIFRDTEEERLPARPISSSDPQQRGIFAGFNTRAPLIGAFFNPFNARPFLQLRSHLVALQNATMCPPGVDTRQLPLDCLEGAPDPATLFEKLGQWGFDTLVIPHGTSWGIMVPALAQWDTQLNRRQHDPEKQTLIEVYSGHGNSEEYRKWRPHDIVDGKAVCPAPTKDYLPCCWRAGEIIRARCANSSSVECEAQVAEAQQKYIAAGLYGHKTISDVTPEDWLDCGQCRDCFNPDFTTRPMATVQYALAVSNFDDPANVLRYRFGFLSSSDNHRAQPGTGYKEKRKAYTDAQGRTAPLGKHRQSRNSATSIAWVWCMGIRAARQLLLYRWLGCCTQCWEKPRGDLGARSNVKKYTVLPGRAFCCGLIYSMRRAGNGCRWAPKCTCVILHALKYVLSER